MLSRQTLGRPPMAETYIGAGGVADTLNSRSMQGGATIVTQFNRDNLEEDAGIAANDEIDDLRRA